MFCAVSLHWCFIYFYLFKWIFYEESTSNHLFYFLQLNVRHKLKINTNFIILKLKRLLFALYSNRNAYLFKTLFLIFLNLLVKIFTFKLVFNHNVNDDFSLWQALLCTKYQTTGRKKGSPVFWKSSSSPSWWKLLRFALHHRWF